MTKTTMFFWSTDQAVLEIAAEVEAVAKNLAKQELTRGWMIVANKNVVELKPDTYHPGATLKAFALKFTPDGVKVWYEGHNREIFETVCRTLGLEFFGDYRDLGHCS